VFCVFVTSIFCVKLPRTAWFAGSASYFWRSDEARGFASQLAIAATTRARYATLLCRPPPLPVLPLRKEVSVGFGAR